MSWVTIIWSVIAAVSFTLATIYLLIWFRERRSWAYLCFFVLAVGVIGLATAELAAMYAKSPAAYGTAIRWGHLAFGFVVLGSLGFVHFYFGTGKWWLLGAALGLRLLAVVANFSTGLNLHIGAIQSLHQVNFLGEPVSMLGEWTPNPWVRLAQLAALAQVVYVVDASLRLWRTGARESRRRAVIVGATLAFFILFASAQAGLVAAGVLRMPIIGSLPFLAVLLAMSYELSRDALRAKQLGRELRESEQRLTVAPDPADNEVTMRSMTIVPVWVPGPTNAVKLPTAENPAPAAPKAPPARTETPRSPTTAPTNVEFGRTILPTVAAQNTGIGIVWVGEARNNFRIDLDLYVQPPRGGPELFFRSKESTEGRYYRDLMHAQPGADGHWQSLWEFVELRGDQMPAAIWVNLYSGVGPVRGEVRVQRRGKILSRAFAFPAIEGNGGVDSNKRGTSPSWVRVELTDLDTTSGAR